VFFYICHTVSSFGFILIRFYFIRFGFNLPNRCAEFSAALGSQEFKKSAPQKVTERQLQILDFGFGKTGSLHYLLNGITELL